MGVRSKVNALRVVMVLAFMGAIDLIFMGSSADRSAADVALPIAAGEKFVSGNGAPGTGTEWYPKTKEGRIKGLFTRSETAAMVQCWLAKTDDKDRNYIYAPSLQTDPVRESIISPLNYVINEGDAIEAAGENAGAVLDVLGIYVAKKPGEEAPLTTCPGALPPGTRLVHATSTFTHVADTVTEGTIAFDDFVPLRDQWYHVKGMSANGATGCGARLVYKEGPNEKDRPGVPVADTSTGLEYQMFFGDFGMFRGQTLPNLEVIAVGADAVTDLYFLITPVSGPGGN